MIWRIKKTSYHWTWKAKLIFLSLLLVLIIVVIKGAYGFLTPEKPIITNVLVVEGWMNDYALEESLAIFNEGKYQFMITTGGPLNTGYILMQYKSTAEVARGTMLDLGADPEKIFAVSRQLEWRDRTYKTALKLKAFLDAEHPNVKSFNLVSLGAHSKRSYLLYQMAMPDFDIGIISIEDQLYNPNSWWDTSKGFRSVVTEMIGYLYVYFFFSPN